MKAIIMIAIFCSFLSGCASLGIGVSSTEQEWKDERAQFRKECKEYLKEVQKRTSDRTENELLMNEQDYLNYKCKEDPFICAGQPKKSAKLIEYETMWGKPYTSPACVFKD